MIKFENFSFSFPEKELYDNISFTLEEGHHCAFIGTSGSGKSTLINILMDPDRYMYDGLLSIDPYCRIGYVSQFLQRNNANDISVFEFIGEKYFQLQEEMAAVCAEMETATELDILLEKYQQIMDALDAIGGDDFESNILKKLNLANLSKLKDSNITEISGGEFKLVQVIKEMMNQPTLMIMDEPDVFLDFMNLKALKDLINTHKGMLFVVTHNRYLLNHCFNKIVHLENKLIQEFDGNFVDYHFTLLQTKIEMQELAIADDEEIARNDALIERLRETATFIADASKGRALGARVKVQERLEAKRIKAPFVEIKQPDIHFHTEHRPGEDTIVKVTDYRAAFDEVILENVHFDIKATDKIAIIGPNGTGKTTLLRDIYQNSHEKIEIAEDVKVAYLSQLQGEMLKESNTIYEEFFDAGFKSYQEIQAYAVDYGFTEELLNQKVSSLSGGEKNILQLAKIASGKADLLLLDEPTSHLDTYAQIALEKAIGAYKGAVLMISHDVYTIINCMDAVFIIDNKTIRKMKMQKFKKMIYASHFDKDYLEHEQAKKTIERKIDRALIDKDFGLAKTFLVELESIIQKMNS